MIFKSVSPSLTSPDAHGDRFTECRVRISPAPQTRLNLTSLTLFHQDLLPSSLSPLMALLFNLYQYLLAL